MLQLLLTDPPAPGGELSDGNNVSEVGVRDDSQQHLPDGAVAFSYTSRLNILL